MSHIQESHYPKRRVAVVYDQQEYLQSCVQKYISLCYTLKVTTNDLGKTRRSYTPFIQEDHKNSPAGKATTGPVTRCPCCYHTFPGGTETWTSVEALEADEVKHKKKVRDKEKRNNTDSGTETDYPDTEPPTDAEDTPVDKKKTGRLQPLAASMLMKVLWAA